MKQFRRDGQDRPKKPAVFSPEPASGDKSRIGFSWNTRCLADIFA